MTLRLAEPPILSVAHEFWHHPRLERMLPAFLLSLYDIVHASVPLMETAERAARHLAGTDPVAARLAPYFAKHADEERQHDEWLLEDLKELDLEANGHRYASPLVAALIGGQYYWVLHAHPVVLMGYLAVLEGNPPDPAELDEIRERLDLPEGLFRTLKLHADLDPHHRDEIFEELEQLELSVAQQTLVSTGALYTADSVGAIFNSLLRSVGEP